MLDDNQIKEVEELAGLFFSIDEVAFIMGVNSQDQTFKKAYDRGSLKSEAEIRKSIIQLAKDGSSPAQAMAWKMVEINKRDQF